MDPEFVLNLAILIFVLVAIAIGVSLLAPIIAQHFKGTSGGWGRLSKVYATTRRLPARVSRRQNVAVGQIIYHRCMTVGLDDMGLYLEPGFPITIFGRRRLFIPWTEFERVEEGRLFWRKAAVLSLGEPLVGTITVPIKLFDNSIRTANRKSATGLVEQVR